MSPNSDKYFTCRAHLNSDEAQFTCSIATWLMATVLGSILPEHFSDEEVDLEKLRQAITLVTLSRRSSHIYML